MSYNAQKKEHDYKKIEKDLAAAAAPPPDEIFDGCNVVLMYGHENYLVRSYEKKLKDLYVDPAADELDHVMLEGENISVDDIISHCDTLPMLSKRRVVTIRNYPAIESAPAGQKPTGQKPAGQKNEESAIQKEDIKKLSGYIDELPDTTLLIFLCGSVSKNKTLYKKIYGSGKCYDLGRLDRKDLSSFIKKRFKGEGKIAGDEVVKEIINITGYFDRESECNLNEIAGDVIKISSFCHDQIVTPADVSNVLATTLETDAFALLDSLSRGNKSEAMLLTNNILESGESGFRLLGLIISQYELMLGIKEYSERNKSRDEIKNEMGIKSDYRFQKVSGYLGKYSVDDLYSILKKLYDVEKNIKFGIYTEKLAMTMFIAQI